MAARTIGGWALLGAAIVSLGCADDNSPTGGGDGTAPGVQGTVTRQKTGVGVPGVTVALVDGSEAVAAATTGPNGEFSVSGVPDGSYEVVPVGLELAGLDPRFDVMEPARDTVVVEGGTSDPLVFAVVGLVPARVTGEVTCGGLPETAATVRVAGGLGTDEEAVPDPLGRYAVLDLLAGVYVVAAQSANCTLVPDYRIVTVRPGEFVRVDFSG
jgi:hypothetical protein